jgi:ATP phosphoribosyltransferase
MLKSEANLIVSRTADWPEEKKRKLNSLLTQLAAEPL